MGIGVGDGIGVGVEAAGGGLTLAGDAGLTYCVEMCGIAWVSLRRGGFGDLVGIGGFGGSGEISTDGLGEPNGGSPVGWVMERLLRNDGRREEVLVDGSVVEAMWMW